MKLHGNLISPFTRMCMVTAQECGLAMRVQLVETSVAPDKVNKELEQLAPLGKVPVMELPNGKAIYDSRVIMEYLASQSKVKGLLPAEGEARFLALTQLALAEGMGDAAVALRYEASARPEATRWPDFANRQRARIAAAMDRFEQQVPEQATLGAIAVACLLSYIDIRALAPDWRKGRPKLAAWHEEFAKRPSMTRTQPRL